MFIHVMLGTNDIERSKRFYDVVLAVLGAGDAIQNTNTTGQRRLFYRDDGSTFCVSEPIDGQRATHGNDSTVGFKAFKACVPASGVSPLVRGKPRRVKPVGCNP